MRLNNDSNMVVEEILCKVPDHLSNDCFQDCEGTKVIEYPKVVVKSHKKSTFGDIFLPADPRKYFGNRIFFLCGISKTSSGQSVNLSKKKQKKKTYFFTLYYLLFYLK